VSQTLLQAFPEPKDIIAAQPEELAGVLLETLPSLLQSGGVTFHALEHVFYPPHGGGYPIPPNRGVVLALAEALAWLQQQGLLVRDPVQPGTWYVLTRRGQQIRTRGDLEAFCRGRELPTALIRPEILEKAHHLYLRGDYDVAVFQAFKIVEMRVREYTSAPAEWPAQKVMRQAFHPSDGLLTDSDLPSSEQHAMSDLFAGAMGHAKNPPSHRDVNLQRQEAARLIVFASYLLDLVELRWLLSPIPSG
jgi:uncharacterized protein (TIGR02391 family)